MVRKHVIRKILFDKGFRWDFMLRNFFREGGGGDFFAVRKIVRGPNLTLN